MARTPTVEMELGYSAPDFLLPNVVSGKSTGFSDVRGERGTVVMFICNHCPFVIHVMDELIRIGSDFKERGIGFVAISSNDVSTHPDDSPEKMKALAEEKAFPFPYLYDETQEVAKAYTAACTPDFSVFNAEAKCVYRGQLDDSRPGNNEPVNGKDLREVLDKLIAGESIPTQQKPSLGCNIKWKVGNEPEYY
ncbi:MAG: thioredoxin family protein [Flavobacteriales bacterium]|nr:thioredoxin family protein [Flavobacteriales bacterium]MCB9186153.1 thioredoxin family protein [Flavobacteriales bacterium]